LAIGLVLSLSSTAIVLQTLGEKGLIKSDGGQAGFSVLLFQDVAVIPMLALIPLLAIPELADLSHTVAESASHVAEAADADHAEGGMSLVAGLNGWSTALVTIAAIATVILGGSYLTRPIFRFIATAQLRELFIATALMMVVGIALLMTLVGLSPALGTFLAGVVLANSEYRHELEADIEPFKGLLLGLFFITVGAGINFGLLGDDFVIIAGLTIVLITLKMAVLYTFGVIFKLRGSDRWLLTVSLAQAGEFGFVLISFTVANSVIPTAVADQLLLIVALSMLLTPLLFILYDRVIAPRYIAQQEREEDSIDESNQIIIAGSGRVGGLVDRMLRVSGYSSTVIDFNSAQIDMLKKFDRRTYFGDATRPDLLHAAGIGEAKLLVVAIDDKEQITELVRYAVRQYPNLHVLARAVDRHHVYDLWAAGCRDVVRETFDSSVRMGRSAFQALGIDSSKALKMAEAFTATDREVMVKVADAYDPEIPAMENELYISRVIEVRNIWEVDLANELKDILAKP